MKVQHLDRRLGGSLLHLTVLLIYSQRVSSFRIPTPTRLVGRNHVHLHNAVDGVTSVVPVDLNDQGYSASDWLHNIQSLPRSSILREIKGPVITIVVWSTLVSIVHKVLILSGKANIANRMCLSSKPHSLLVNSLGLLLVFRTNTAYQRFAEGRKIWENILSVSRNTSRMATLYVHDLGTERLQRILILLAVFPYLLQNHIQPQCLENCELLQEHALLLHEPTSQAVVHGRVQSFRRKKQCSHPKECCVDRRSLPWCLLPPKVLQKCANSANRPLWVCDRLSQELTNVPYSDNFTSRERLTFISHIGNLSRNVGECERIHQTAVPLNYARHSLRSLTFWLFTLPFCLIGELNLLTGPVMGLIAWIMLGVYQIGYMIEDPFQGSLRLRVLCDAIYRDVMSNNNAGLINRQSAFEIDPEELSEWKTLAQPPAEPQYAQDTWQ